MRGIKLPEELRQSVIEARLKGATYGELVARFNLAKSSIAVILRNTEVSPDLLALIRHNGCIKVWNNRSDKDYILTKFTNAERKGKSDIANSYYRNDELEVKPVIDSIFGVTNKEKIAGNWFDFCNDKYVIEYTYDATRGIQNAYNRFLNLDVNYNRSKIVIAPRAWFGKVRQNRFVRINVKIIFCDELSTYSVV